MKSYIVQNASNEAIHISPLLQNQTLLACYESDIKTLHDAFLHGLVESKNGPCLGWRPKPDLPYIWITYSQTLERAQLFGSGLALDGASLNQSQLIGIYAQNRVEWIVAAQACCSFSMILVPFFPNFPLQFLRHFINKYRINYMIVDTVEKVLALLEECKKKRIILSTIVMMDNDKEVVSELANEIGVSVKSFIEIELFGKHSLRDFELPMPDDINSICFTSGVNELPKGVILTHANFVASLLALRAFGNMADLPLKSSDVYLSFLTLSHSMERHLITQMLFSGGSIGFYHGNTKKLLDDVRTLQPTIMLFYPLLLNSLIDVMQNLSPRFSFQRFIRWVGLRYKLYQFNKGIYKNDTLCDKLAFSDFKKLFGGKLKSCILSVEQPSTIQHFIKATLGISLVTGYSLWEATATVALSLPDDYIECTSNYLLPCNAVKLVDIPELDFYAENQEGEIVIKGANVFQGYYKEENQTNNVFDKEGWFHTCDIGRWLTNGGLQTIGSKDNVYRLLNDQIVVAEKVEFLLEKTPRISQTFVYSNKKFSSLVAIVVLSQQNLMQFLSSYSHLHNNSLQNKVLKDLQKTGKKQNLSIFEIPEKIHLIDTPFTVENGLLTVTFKKRRHQIFEKYRAELMQMLESF